MQNEMRDRAGRISQGAFYDREGRAVVVHDRKDRRRCSCGGPGCKCEPGKGTNSGKLRAAINGNVGRTFE